MSSLGNLIRSWFGAPSGSSTDALQEAIEVVVDNSTPKIRLVRGYKKKLKPPVESALDFIADLIKTIPGPIDATDQSLADNLLIKAFFLNRDEFEAIISVDEDLNAFFAENQPGDFFVMLGMQRDAKTTFGSRLQGDIVVRDVAMQSVTFSDQRFRAPSVSMDAAYQNLALGVLQVLAHQALEIILAEQARQTELEQLADELTAKIKAMARARRNLVLKKKDAADMHSYQEGQELLNQVEAELNTIETEQRGQNYYLDRLIQVLQHPENYITTELSTLHLDRTGILLSGKSDDPQKNINVLDVQLSDNPLRSVVFLKCNRETLMEV